MPARPVVAVGFAMTAVMHALFLVGGGDRGPIYLVLTAVAMAAAVMATVGARLLPRRDGATALAAGLLLGFVARLALVVTGLSRLPVWVNASILFGLAYAGAAALAWSLRPKVPAAQRTGHIAFGVWILAAGHAYSAFRALNFGALLAAFALVIGSVGFFLVAPNLDMERAEEPASAL